MASFAECASMFFFYLCMYCWMFLTAAAKLLSGFVAEPGQDVLLWMVQTMLEDAACIVLGCFCRGTEAEQPQSKKSLRSCLPPQSIKSLRPKVNKRRVVIDLAQNETFEIPSIPGTRPLPSAQHRDGPTQAAPAVSSGPEPMDWEQPQAKSVRSCLPPQSTTFLRPKVNKRRVVFDLAQNETFEIPAIPGTRPLPSAQRRHAPATAAPAQPWICCPPAPTKAVHSVSRLSPEASAHCLAALQPFFRMTEDLSQTGWEPAESSGPEPMDYEPNPDVVYFAGASPLASISSQTSSD